MTQTFFLHRIHSKMNNKWIKLFHPSTEILMYAVSRLTTIEQTYLSTITYLPSKEILQNNAVTNKTQWGSASLCSRAKLDYAVQRDRHLTNLLYSNNKTKNMFLILNLTKQPIKLKTKLSLYSLLLKYTKRRTTPNTQLATWRYFRINYH